MASLKTIRKRITSVKATQKITRAMKMVAGARLNRAQQRITALRPYALKTQEILAGVAAAMIAKQTDLEYSGQDTNDGLHPLLQRRAEKNVLLLVLSGDRGLCGAFNANVSKAAVQRVAREEGSRRRGSHRDGRQEGPRVPRAPQGDDHARLPEALRRARPRQGARSSPTT